MGSCGAPVSGVSETRALRTPMSEPAMRTRPRMTAVWAAVPGRLRTGSCARANVAATRTRRTVAGFMLSIGLAARGESLAAFDGRCILAGCVAPPLNTPGIRGRRALPARRLARLGATPHFHHGLLGVALPGQERQREAHRRRLPMPSKAQRHVDALTWCENTVGQKHAAIGITGARPAAGVRHLDLERQAACDHKQMRVHRRRAVVGEPVHPSVFASASAMPFSLAVAVSTWA